MLKRILLAVVVAGFCSTGATAQSVVFNNSEGVTFDNLIFNDLSAIIGGETVDDFTLTEDTQLTAVTFGGNYSPDALAGGDGVVAAGDDNFTINIYSAVGGAPGELVDSFAVGNNVNRVDNGVLPVGLGGDDAAVFSFSAAIDFEAAADTTYFLSVLNNTTADPDNFNQLISSVGGNAFGDLNPNDGVFTATSFVTDFQLEGTTVAAVPEPSSLALLAIGAVGFVARRRRS